MHVVDGVIFAGWLVFWIYWLATAEERFMASRFPETYPAYKRSTKMLIPFVF